MSSKPAAKPTIANENAAVTKPRAARTKAAKTTPVVEVASSPRVKTVKHSKAPVQAVEPTFEAAKIGEFAQISVHDQIAKIAYGYWEARGFQPGSPEQDWLRAEREYLRKA